MVELPSTEEDIQASEKPVFEDERTGEIEYRHISNDGSMESLKLLSNAKALFQKQLPKMPGEYVARLVYDRLHSALIILKPPVEIFAGILYRLFEKQQLAELVFCAVQSHVQVRDHLWEVHKVRYIMTYADNYAVGFFRKQGFTKEINLDESIWKGFIKDYEGGTMMQCITIPEVKYSDLGQILVAQKKALWREIRKRSSANSHSVYPGLNEFPLDPLSIPGEAGWTKSWMTCPRESIRSPANRKMQLLVDELMVDTSAWPFLKPVNRDDVPDYYKVIKRPMDLSTIEAKVTQHLYASMTEFCQDVQLIFDNCRLYNEEGSIYTRCAQNLEFHFWSRVRELQF